MHSSCLVQLLFKCETAIFMAYRAQHQLLRATTGNYNDCSHMSVPASPQGFLVTEALRLHNLTTVTCYSRAVKYQIYFRKTAI